MHSKSRENGRAYVEGAFNQVNERLGSIERRLDSIDSRFNWLTGIVLSTWITTLLTILFHR